MEEEATVPGGARGELRWPPVMARNRPEEIRSIVTFMKLERALGRAHSVAYPKIGH